MYALVNSILVIHIHPLDQIRLQRIDTPVNLLTGRHPIEFLQMVAGKRSPMALVRDALGFALV